MKKETLTGLKRQNAEFSKVINDLRDERYSLNSKIDKLEKQLEEKKLYDRDKEYYRGQTDGMLLLLSKTSSIVFKDDREVIQQEMPQYRR